jgi:hypothetical protein
MLCQNDNAGCLCCLHSTTKHLYILWRCKGKGAPPPDEHSQLSTEPTPALPGMAPPLTGNHSRDQIFEIIDLIVGHISAHTYLPRAEFLTLDASAKDRQLNADIDPDMLTDEGTTTAKYIICCQVMQITSIFTTRAAI